MHQHPDHGQENSLQVYYNHNKKRCKQEFCTGGYINSKKCYYKELATLIECIQLPCSCTGFSTTITYLKKWNQLEAQNYSFNYGANQVNQVI